jgi:hypothetical protein
VTDAHKSVISARNAAVLALGSALVCGSVACDGGTGTSVGKPAGRGLGEALLAGVAAAAAGLRLAGCCGRMVALLAAVPVAEVQPAASTVSTAAARTSDAAREQAGDPAGAGRPAGRTRHFDRGVLTGTG